MAENVPESTYFPHDREQLLNTLARFDDGLRVEDVVGPENEAYNLKQHSNTVLLQVFLELLCYTIVKDENQREKLIIEACKRLSKAKIINDTLIMEKSQTMRKAMKQNVIKFLNEVLEDVVPTAELDSEALSFFENDSVSADIELIYSQNFHEMCQIGKGGFGSVYKAQYKLNKIIYAIKKIPFIYKTDTCFLRVMREVNNFASLSHPNIVRYHSAWIEIKEPGSVNKSSSHDDIQSIRRHSGIVITQASSKSSGSLRANDFKKDPNKVTESESDSIISLESPTIPEGANLSAEYCCQNSFNPSHEEKDSNKNDKSAKDDSNEDNESAEYYTNEDNTDLESESDSIIFSESATIPKDANWSVGNSSQISLNHSDYDNETIGDNSNEDDEFIEDNTKGKDNADLKLKGLLYIQMEYCDCDLSFWLSKRAETKGKELAFEMDVYEIFLSIVKGVHHIHSRNIIHRDLKPHNIFYSKAYNTVRIGDFGLATLAGCTESSNYESCKHSSNVGTIPYAAPEQRNSKIYDTKVDIYSLGIILIELINICDTRSELCHVIKAMKEGETVDGMNKFPVLGKLSKSLISDDPELRMSAKEIINLIDEDSKVKLREEIMHEFMDEIKKKDDKIKALEESVQSMQEFVQNMEENKKEDDKIKALEESVQKKDEKIKALEESVQSMQELIQNMEENMKSIISWQNSEKSRLSKNNSDENTKSE